MTVNNLVSGADLFFLLFARLFALFSVSPLIGSQAVPGPARAGLALMSAAAVFPWASQGNWWVIPDNGWAYAALVLGEALLGLFQGFLLLLIFTVLQNSGQLLAMPMGFGASEVFDPMAQIELPLVGQLFNLLATLVFLSVQGFQKMFLVSIAHSLRAIRATDFLAFQGRGGALIGAFAELFLRSILLALPILGVLIMVNVAMGLLGKAAPQMNLMMLGFPIAILTGYVVMFFTLPFVANAFSSLLDRAFELVLRAAGAKAGGL